MNGNSYQTIRAIRAPITLITIGILFALQNFTRFGFDQTWPVLLIVFGLLSLMQRGAAPPKSPVPPAPPRPSVPPPPPRPFTTYAQSPYAQPPVSAPPPPPAGPGDSQGGAV